MDSNEKLQLDDITLDDIISGEGVTTVEPEVEKPTADEAKAEVDQPDAVREVQQP